MTSLIAACGSGRSASVIPAVPAAWSVTTIAFIACLPDKRLEHESRSYGRGGVSRSDDRNDFELGEVLPVRHPFIEQPAIRAFHDLKTAAKVLSHPTAAIFDSVRHQASLLVKTPVHRDWISVPKRLDDHVEHVGNRNACAVPCHARRPQAM